MILTIKAALVVGIVFLSILFWTGLHDIIKGEDNLNNEYIAVIFSSVLIPLMIYAFFRRIKYTDK